MLRKFLLLQKSFKIRGYQRIEPASKLLSCFLPCLVAPPM